MDPGSSIIEMEGMIETVACDVILRRLVICSYAAYSSVWTTVLGRVCYCLFSSLHICSYPVAGEVDTQHKPNTTYVTRFAKRSLIHAQYQDILFIAIC